MGLFKKFVIASYKMAQEANKAASEQAKHPQVPSSNINVKTSISNNTNTDYTELLGLYKSYNFPDNLDVQKQIKQVNPHADEHTCPYCGVIHDFTATRARKCPDCKNKMVVRQGRFLTEDQANKMEASISEYYNQRSAWSQLEYSLKNAQNAKVSDYGSGSDYPAAIAECFRHATKLKNIRDSKGFDYWDRSWKYFNEARALAATDKYQPYYMLSRISYNMAEMLIDQSKYTSSEQSKQKILRTAAYQIIMSIGESTKEEDWNTQSSYVYERLKLITHNARISNADLDEASVKVSQVLRLNKKQTELLNGEVQKAKSYELIGTTEL